VEANPGYALARALLAGDEAKAATWRGIFEAMLSGALAIGSRTPVADTPAWATLEVAAGGFATGRLLAAGPLRPHEEVLLTRLGLPQERGALNAYFLSEEGMAVLRERLREGTYRIEVPEEAALLVVAWLLDHGDADGARAILDAIGPWLGRLRFYPVPHPEASITDERVCVQPVGDTIAQLEHLRERERVLAQREAALWRAREDNLLTLVMETVVDGWPCRVYPEDWHDRVDVALAEIARRQAAPHRCRRIDRARSNLARLVALLSRASDDALTARDVGELRGILARVDAKRGLPGTARLESLRSEQARRNARPTRKEQAKLLLERLSFLAPDRGIDEVDPLLAAPDDDEAARFALPKLPLSPRLRPALLRSLAAPLETLIDARAIRSGETMARVLPQLTAPIAAAGVRDVDLRRLYAALYQAFRRRRSLLLLNLQHQVRIEELPWAAAVAHDELADRFAARATLTRVVSLALVTWPETILPNKLLQELTALATRAGLSLPLTEELAADIFMGQLTDKFVLAAQRAVARMQGTLYARYYDLPPRAPDQPEKLVALCAARARIEHAPRSVARNGALLEQLQILTTHDLAILIGGLGMPPRIAAALPDLARRAFTGAITRLARPGLRARKQAAYAWRQMLFYLSLAPPSAQDPFLAWTSDEVRKLSPGARGRIGPYYAGLCLAAAGAPPGEVFHGWVVR
jgi:hypothetical protein